MSQSRILKEVKEFIARYLPSVEHLEVFMLLQQNPARSWSPADVAAELAIPDHAAAGVLERLASDNFLDIRILKDVVYRFNPVSPALAEVAARCADTYRRERILLTKLATAAATGPMHDFADSFRLKRDKGSG
jgi:hypothetical protein